MSQFYVFVFYFPCLLSILKVVKGAKITMSQFNSPLV